MDVKKITALTVLVALMVTLEQVLAIIPSVQVTTLLIVLISTSFDKKLGVAAIFVYVTLDNILGGFTVLYPFMLLSWTLFLLFINLNRKRGEFFFAVSSLIFGFVHMMILGLPTIVIYKLNFFAYLISDIPFTAVFMLVNFLTVLWLYRPLKKIIDIYV